MSNEEFDRKMDFIVEQHAKFVAGIQLMREVRDADTKRFKEETRQLSELNRSLSATMAAHAAQTSENLAALTEAGRRTDDRLAELAEAGRRTDDRLNVLINTVERYISGNGEKSPGDGA